ncbi:MAG: acyl carrier protein [Idiomarina sp.]
MRDTILTLMNEAAETTGAELQPTIDKNTVLLESGLDSLGFAILVARLEEELGYDPFSLMDEPVYPRTFGEFVAIYERFAPE